MVCAKILRHSLSSMVLLVVIFSGYIQEYWVFLLCGSVMVIGLFFKSCIFNDTLDIRHDSE